MCKNYKLKSGNYLKIDMIDEGYQYYLYEEDKKLIDEGILENSKLNDTEALRKILIILDIPIDIEYQEMNEEIEESSNLGI